MIKTRFVLKCRSQILQVHRMNMHTYLKSTKPKKGTAKSVETMFSVIKLSYDANKGL